MPLAVTLFKTTGSDVRRNSWFLSWHAHPLVVPLLLLISFLSGCASLPGNRTIRSATGAVEVSQRPGPQPTVVFEAGLGSYKESWGTIFDDIARTNSVFAYNRPGIGRSEMTGTPRDGRTVVDNLRALLRSGNLRPPFVLVGHSAGGLYMQLYARLHPREVAGLVLVDPTHPEAFEGEGRLARRGAVAVAAIKIAGLFGPIRDELDALSETGRQILAAPPLSDRIPTVILVAPDRSGSEIAAFENAKRQDYRRLYPTADFREVDSGHNIPRENPRSVIDAIRDILGRTNR